MTDNLNVTVSDIKIFRKENLVKGVARVDIQAWGIQIDNVTWKLERGGVKSKFPVIKQPGKISPLFLICFDEKKVEKAVKKEISQQIKAHLSAQIEPMENTKKNAEA